MVFDLSQTKSVASQFMAELRDRSIQSDPVRFRNNLDRIGEILGYEISKKLSYEMRRVETPLGIANCEVLSRSPILIPILRAGIPMFQGMLRVFDRADSGFIGAWRLEEDGEAELSQDPEVALKYLAAPSIEGRDVIIIDPMLATGKSVIIAIKHLLQHGTPRQIHIASVIACKQGINKLKENVKLDYSLWVGAIDDELNDKAYIVPGLGDAGDLSFGLKI